eukprot:TRINITY_DN156_c0_g1_i6.p1 TRINITY_DN156_c0_g1~~TRINITY_DN156_c0_g1_i6.p1  ORF type:complete len:256 (-),score=49.59 TRINITY_DN156_c0_g1_i6:81-848(-)
MCIRDRINTMREVAILGRKVLDYAHSLIKPGRTTDDIDLLTHQFIIDNDAYPSPLNYYKFPKSLCTSVNEVICHGIPDERPLEDGDIVNCDITILKNGFNADLNETFMVGESVDADSKFLISKTYECLQRAEHILKPGTKFKEIGNVIGKFIEDNGLSVVKSYTGHGIGSLFHCAPNIPHYRLNSARGEMKVGNVFTIEPMINQGSYKDTRWPDDWTAVTMDGKRSAQFENTYVITEGGFECLTKRFADSPLLGI